MATSLINGVEIAGVVCGVPSRVETTDDLALRFGVDAAERIAAATGIRARARIAPGRTARDLATVAATDLLSRLDWDPASITLLVDVTQTRERPLPGDGHLVHQGLGLSKNAVVLDVSLGCSGWVHGLWMTAALLRSLGGGRALLLAGDAASTFIDRDDRATAPLFGDAVAATALVSDPDAAPMSFDLGADGSGSPYLTVAGGGARLPDTPSRLFMDGTQVFAFTLREVPDSLRAALTGAGWTTDDVDHFVPHQANAQMIRRLARKIGIPAERAVEAATERGNTGAASIPLALCDALADRLTTGPRRLLLTGFGVGWSWSSVALSVGPLRVCRVTTAD